MPEAAAGTVAAGPPQCEHVDKTSAQRCAEPAVVTALWPWGEAQKVCPRHQGLAQQTAENIGRTVSFAPLALPGEPPLERSERARLKGEVYAAEAEIAELKQRGLNLYQENVALTRQLQSQSVTLNETKLQLQDARGDLTAAQELLEERGAQLATAVNELERLRTLVKFADTNATNPEALHRVGLSG